MPGYNATAPLRNDATELCMLAGTGRTGYMPVPPNNYPFYSEDEKYVPVVQADGGQLSGASDMPGSPCFPG